MVALLLNATQIYADKAVKAVGTLYSKAKVMEIPVKIMLNLFDSFASSTLCTNIQKQTY